MTRVALHLAMGTTIALAACATSNGEEPAAELPVDTITPQLKASSNSDALLKPGQPVRSDAAEVHALHKEMRAQRARIEKQAAATDLDALLTQIKETADPQSKVPLIDEYLIAAGAAHPAAAAEARSKLQAVLEATP
jgi:hypothetical protein